MFLREPSHILILLIVILVLFGAKRLPDSARSLGRSMRIFKSEMKELNTDEKKTEGDTSPEK
jgi:TatA/E family protein of Tat protein translocase